MSLAACSRTSQGFHEPPRLTERMDGTSEAKPPAPRLRTAPISDTRGTCVLSLSHMANDNSRRGKHVYSSVRLIAPDLHCYPANKARTTENFLAPKCKLRAPISKEVAMSPALEVEGTKDQRATRWKWKESRISGHRTGNGTKGAPTHTLLEMEGKEPQNAHQ